MLIASSISDPSLPYHCKQHIIWFYDRFAIVTLALSIPNTWCQVLQCVILRVALDPIWFCDRYDTTTCNCDISPFKVWNVVVYISIHILVPFAWIRCCAPGELGAWLRDEVTMNQARDQKTEATTLGMEMGLYGKHGFTTGILEFPVFHMINDM